ncbi:thioesterase domain-containing protein [Arthrobacter mobilis]|uniref:Alpha/beta hydrolase n=1 Tax=Arthrobacter mobilis TaxID=2724944 RepID=A0A7X6HG01_9MICC|nr:thioesterase domain-containing protein [Arthrobacter mobilis]NKX55007.1 alpha/beta hydrolase [Arthrobacter mobilis]
MEFPDKEAVHRLRLASGLHQVSRRSFLIAAGFGLATSADLLVTRRLQAERSDPRILVLEDEAARRRFPRSSWVLFPGYKTSWEEGLWILNSLRPALTRRGQLAMAGYSNRGLDLAHLAEVLQRHIEQNDLNRLYFYGHSFGGMVAVEMTARLQAKGYPVELILMDCTPYSRFDVIDRTMFEGVVFAYEAGYQVPTVLRGGYELGERIVNKHERSWRTVIEQSMAQLSPLAVSSRLIQSQSAYIYHFEGRGFAPDMGSTKIAWMGNPADKTVNYGTARRSWLVNFKDNFLTNELVTAGALPAHASPQWNPAIYQPLIQQVEDAHFPVPFFGGLRRPV